MGVAGSGPCRRSVGPAAGRRVLGFSGDLAPGGALGVFEAGLSSRQPLLRCGRWTLRARRDFRKLTVIEGTEDSGLSGVVAVGWREAD